MTFFVIEKCGDRIFLLVQEQLTLTRSEGEEETDESFKAKTEIAEMEQHIPKGIEANYFEVEKAKDGGEDVTAKAGGEKGKMSILNTIEKSAESKDYHLKNEKAEDKEDTRIDLGEDQEANIIVQKLKTTKNIATIIMENIPFYNRRNLYLTILKEMKLDKELFSNKDINDWEDNGESDIKKWYDGKSIKFASK